MGKREKRSKTKEKRNLRRQREESKENEIFVQKKFVGEKDKLIYKKLNKGK